MLWTCCSCSCTPDSGNTDCRGIKETCTLVNTCWTTHRAETWRCGLCILPSEVKTWQYNTKFMPYVFSSRTFGDYRRQCLFPAPDHCKNMKLLWNKHNLISLNLITCRKSQTQTKSACTAALVHSQKYAGKQFIVRAWRSHFLWSCSERWIHEWITS